MPNPHLLLVGGLLFAVEEGASHFDQNMLWRVSACSIISFFSLTLIKSCILGVPGQMSNGGLISFGEFDNAAYNFYQVRQLTWLLLGLV